MHLRHTVFRAGAAALLLGAAACETNPETGNERVAPAGVGAVSGAALGATLGAILGGRNNRAEAIIGAGIGAIAGAAIADAVSRSERDLERDLAGTGAVVTREGESLRVSFPGSFGFSQGSDRMRPGFQAELDDVAMALRGYRESYVDIYGYAEAQEAGGRRLAQARADAVADHLVARGVDEARVATAGRTGREDRYGGDDASGQVELLITPVRESDLRR